MMHEQTESEVRASVLEYARFHGLTRDYRSTHPLEGLKDEIAAAQVEEIPSLFESDKVHRVPPLERLTINKEGASLLASVFKIKNRESISFDEFLPDYRRVERMKVEQPLLSSDHELDMIRFKCRIVPDLNNMNIPLEEVDDELDEGMGWPSSYNKIRQQAIEKLKNEKLVFPKETFVYLSNALKPLSPDCKDSLVQEEVEKLVRRSIVAPISPPLLPMSPPILPFVPPQEACQFELLSEHSSPTRETLKRFDAQFMKANSIKRNKDRDSDGTGLGSEINLSGDVYSPLTGIENTRLQRPEDLKVEVPLSPLSPANPAPWKGKAGSFPESLFEIIPDLPPMIDKPEGDVSSDVDGFFAKTVAPVAAVAKRRIEQEQLEEADALSKVKVPTMDFSRPVAPWDLTSLGAKGSTKDTRTRTFLKDIVEKHFKAEIWNHSAKEERSLQWALFPAHLARVTTHETIEIEEGELNSWIAQPPCMDIDTLVRKSGGLRLAQANGPDEDEIEPGIYPPSNDFAVLLKRKAAEMGTEDGAEAALLKTAINHGLMHSKKPRTDSVINKGRTFTAESRSCSLDRHKIPNTSRPATRGTSDVIARHVKAKSDALEQSFSTFTSIGNYMSLRTGQQRARVVSESPFFTPKKSALGDMGPPPRPSPRHEESAKPKTPHSSSHVVPVPTPAIDLPQKSHQFIASATSLLNKKVWRQIYALYPDACIIERDFSIPPSMGPPISNPIFNDENLLAHEADIALSPSTGLIWTTLQKIKQRSLPGQVASSPVRERIIHTAPRYEHLIILISQGCSPNEPLTLTDSDAIALATLTSFCACLSSNLEIILIPGCDHELAQWTVHLMIKHGNGVPHFELQQEETLWEVWLRRAGMNAFAAQYIISQMQAPVLSREDMVLDKYRGEFGLAPFVTMGAKEREGAFAGVVGRELLRRMDKNIGERWGRG